MHFLDAIRRSSSGVLTTSFTNFSKLCTFIFSRLRPGKGRNSVDRKRFPFHDISPSKACNYCYYFMTCCKIFPSCQEPNVMGAPSLLPATIKLTCVLSQQWQNWQCGQGHEYCIALQRSQSQTRASFNQKRCSLMAFAPGKGSLRSRSRSRVGAQVKYINMHRREGGTLLCHRYPKTCKSQFPFSAESQLHAYNVLVKRFRISRTSRNHLAIHERV